MNAAVRRLRDALNDKAETPRFVETLPRRGYRLDTAGQTPDINAFRQAIFPQIEEITTRASLLEPLIAEFQRGVEAQLSGDARSHYDLAMSYREMGLLEQAVESFRVAAEDPAFGLRAMEMVGRCLLDQGRFDEAIEEFERALAHGDLDSTARVSLRYELALAHQAAGHAEIALAEFERVHGEHPGFSDVERRLGALRKTPRPA